MGLVVDNGQSGEGVNTRFYYSNPIYIYSMYFIFIINHIPFLGIGVLACLSIEALIFCCASNTPPQAEYSPMLWYEVMDLFFPLYIYRC